MKISYAVTVCNELTEIQRLLTFLAEHKYEDDEIVVLYDSVNGSQAVEQFLRASTVNRVGFRWHEYEFTGDFSEMKNRLTSLCTGDYIFQIDADEVPNWYLMQYLPVLLEMHNVDVLRVPRINTVEGITEAHMQKWGWVKNHPDGRINWPDLQWRIYRRTPEIKWKNKVHEVLDGYKTFAILPLEDSFALEHHKQIDRQEKQNAYYDKLWK